MKEFRKVIVLILAFGGIAVNGFSQKKGDDPNIPSTAQDSLRKYELELQALGDSMIDGTKQAVRIKALMRYVPTLVRALKFEGSISYPFDSLKFMKMLAPEDKSFRLYNWALKYDDGSFRYYGAIQVNRKDSFKLIPLRDYREKHDTVVENIVVSPDQWVGALYYSMITQKIKGRPYYTLLGWDGDQYISDKKIIDVLHFEKGNAIFGAPIFEIKGIVKTRVVFQFSGDATMLLQYVPDYKMITFDKLVPPNKWGEGMFYTYVPDGTYDYFTWKKGKWIFEEELFENFRKPIKEAGE
jgi:hypothetical protein